MNPKTGNYRKVGTPGTDGLMEKYPGSYEIWGGRRIVEQYLDDDLYETLTVDDSFSQSTFLLSKLVPTTYERVSTMGTATLWKMIMLAWSYENNLAIPQKGEKRGITGGLSRLINVGYAKNIVKLNEPIERYCIYLTNQHTDMHLLKIKQIADMKQYGCYIVQGKVKNNPKIIEGGHMFFTLYDDSGEIECGAYEPTKDFRKIVKKLRPEDIVKLYGGIGEQGTFNIEKFYVVKLNKFEYKNPKCKCGKRMTSAGKGKGFKCKKCGNKIISDSKVPEKIFRSLKEQNFYETPISARRHLAKPIVRMKFNTLK